ncbi:DUF2306 domain-containing protein [Microbispora sp. GKU 823]|uniref:DUF2306 domain-containing protein n=1 Tax=Microbispora sp. GKU 823 TaxID=1652100 RepID=UPI001C4DFF13|nr:DUF2306 domain-containing protein [Microbispora sp. GKU 823]
MTRIEIEKPVPKAGDLNGRPHGEQRWWRRPWIVPLAIVVAAFLVYQTSPFARAGLDETKAPIPPHDGFSLYYPLLLTHIIMGSVTMVTVVLQLWPRLRRRRPAVHRWAGRIYVVATLVTGVAGLVIVRFAPVTGQIGVTMATVLWLVTTIVAYIAAVRGKWVLHRRFMLYSFALVMNNVWGPVIVNIGIANHVQLPYLIEAARWFGWVVNLMLVQWWLYRTAGRPLDVPPDPKTRARRTVVVS